MGSIRSVLTTIKHLLKHHIDLNAYLRLYFLDTCYEEGPIVLYKPTDSLVVRAIWLMMTEEDEDG